MDLIAHIIAYILTRNGIGYVTEDSPEAGVMMAVAEYVAEATYGCDADPLFDRSESFDAVYIGAACQERDEMVIFAVEDGTVDYWHSVA